MVFLHFSISEKTTGKSAVLVNNLTCTLNCKLVKVLSNQEHHELLKYLRNVYCVVTIHSKDQDMQANHKRIGISVCGLVFSHLIGFSLQHNYIPEIFF